MVIIKNKYKTALRYIIHNKMNVILIYLKKHKIIYTIIILFLLIELYISFSYKDVWWDSSVYIGMGKYIYSNGKLGLWEESRPLVLPIILGLGWLVGFNAVYFGKTISIIFAVLTIFVTYKIGLKLFSKNIGILAAFFVAFSYTFLFFSQNILTEIPATLFTLLAFYFFITDRFFLTGFFSGLALMTRFFQIFALIGLCIVFLTYFSKKPNFLRKFSYIVLGASIFIVPYLLLNYYLYNDVILPFKVQAHLTKTTGWTQYREFGFYFTGLLKENFLIILLAATPFFFKKNYKFYVLLSIPLIYLLVLSFAKHKEMRFIIVIMPFLYLIMAYCILQIYNKISYKKFTFGLFFIVIILWLLTVFSSFKEDIASYELQKNNYGFIYFQDYLIENRGNLWITNPLYALYSNNRINGLIYFYSSKNLIKFVNENKDKVDIVLFNNCDIPCPPADLDPLCAESRKILYNALSNLKKIYDKEINNCRYQIFGKNT